ncbi:MAG: phosphoribosylglycinamide formyltransferase [Saprospiraceae bacterium]
MKNIAIFASGTGSNATKIVEHFNNHPTINVALIISNKKTAKVLDMAKSKGISTLLINRTNFYQSEDLLTDLADYQIDFIALAGFLWLIPPYLVKHFPNRMVNIHPALLPKYGGKGMYGQYIHQAVRANNESTSGITLHYVNEHYDEGNIIFQASCPVATTDSAQDIAKNVLKLEHYYFPRILESLLAN